MSSSSSNENEFSFINHFNRALQLNQQNNNSVQAGNMSDNDDAEDEDSGDLTCRLPQQLVEFSGNCDEGEGEESTISAVDLRDSDSSSVVSYIHPSDWEKLDTNTDSSVVSFVHPSDFESLSSATEDEEEANSQKEEAVWETVTISDTPSEASSSSAMSSIKSPAKRCSPVDGNKRKRDRIKRLRRSSFKRTHDMMVTSSVGSIVSISDEEEQQQQFSQLPSMASSPKVTTTRSGRTIRARMDIKFDYSSERNNHKDDDDDADDDDFDGTEEDVEAYEEAESSDEDYSVEVANTPKWACRKQRRISHSHSSSSSSHNSSNSHSSLNRLEHIYLDLRQPVAGICLEVNIDHNQLANDNQLQTRLNKFLGLVAPRRRLYNPADDLDVPAEQPQLPEQQRVSPNRSRLMEQHNATPTQPAPQSTWSALNLSNPQPVSILERQTKFFDDMVHRVNGISYMGMEMEPLDLSGLPSQSQRDTNCRLHKSCLACLEQHPLFYSFVESLSPEISLNMCHPLAQTYRERDFSQHKTSLAKVLFNMFNHAIFRCGLQPNIMWKRGMNVLSACQRSVDAKGQRKARIILSEQISQSMMLVKALLHEMCHAAAFVFNMETGHGDNCRKWAHLAKTLLPELPVIGDCDPTYKYSCYLCGGCSFGNAKFEEELDFLRCAYCQFEITVEPWNSNDHAQTWSRADQLITPYKTFVRENYMQIQWEEMESGANHSCKMRHLNVAYLKQKGQMNNMVMLMTPTPNKALGR